MFSVAFGCWVCDGLRAALPLSHICDTVEVDSSCGHPSSETQQEAFLLPQIYPSLQLLEESSQADLLSAAVASALK